MYRFRARNAAEMMKLVYPALRMEGVMEASRNGPVLRFNQPVCLEYVRPYEKVVLCPVRDANPFFHLMEGILMLSGHNDVEWLSYFNAGMRRYSDDGFRFNAFYGERLRRNDGDQLTACAAILANDPTSRQAVANIWHPVDLYQDTLDKACNLSIVFAVNNGCVDMTVFNRSNDAIWGSVSGANVVHFAMFQEYVAAVAGYPVGSYYQISNNLHVYVDNPQTTALLNHYKHGMDGIEEYPLIDPILLRGDSKEQFDDETARFVKMTKQLIGGGVPPGLLDGRFKSRFYQGTAEPMFNAWFGRKSKLLNPTEVQAMINQVRATDWCQAASEWVDRRECAR